jgi:flagellar biosynthetic protein FliR
MSFLDQHLIDPILQWSNRELLALAMQHFYAFTLVLVRVSGLMTIGPVFGMSVVPANVRVLIVVTLSLLVTPTLSRQQEAGFDRLDLDRDGQLTQAEIPEVLRVRFDIPSDSEESVTLAQYRTAPHVPQTLFEYAWLTAGEFVLGLVLGLGVLAILSGLQLAGEIIDQQSGVALGEIASPGLEISGATTGRFLYLFGITALLLAHPLSGHLQIVGALLESFQTLPVGEAFVSITAVELLRDVVHQSLVLGIQAAAPVFAVMSLVGITMGYLGHSVPQIQVLVLGFPIRAILSFLVLAVSLTGIGRQVCDVVPAVIDALRAALTGLG